MCAICGIKNKSRTIDRDIEMLDLERDAVDYVGNPARPDPARSAAGRDRQLGGLGIDFDPSP